MCAPVLLNLLNELGKRDKIRGLSSILSLFRNEFNTFNNTGTLFLTLKKSADDKKEHDKLSGMQSLQHLWQSGFNMNVKG